MLKMIPSLILVLSPFSSQADAGPKEYLVAECKTVEVSVTKIFLKGEPNRRADGTIQGFDNLEVVMKIFPYTLKADEIDTSKKPQVLYPAQNDMQSWIAKRFLAGQSLAGAVIPVSTKKGWSMGQDLGTSIPPHLMLISTFPGKPELRDSESFRTTTFYLNRTSNQMMRFERRCKQFDLDGNALR